MDSALRTTVVTLLCAATGATAAIGQRPTELRRVVEFGRVRIVFPSELDADTGLARLIATTLWRQTPLRGLEPSVLDGMSIGISLRQGIAGNLDGSASPGARTIFLPYPRVRTWSQDHLGRVLRHELAHLGIGAALNYAVPPDWFGEGLAEWMTGEITCQAEARIRLRMSMVARGAAAPPRLEVGGETKLTSYDFFASFFEFLDALRPSALRDGMLLRVVANHGVDAGLRMVFAQSPGQLEADWLRYLHEQYGVVPLGFMCAA